MIFLKVLLLNITAFFISLMPVPSFKEGVAGQPQSFFASKAQTQHERSVSTFIYRSLFKYDIYGVLNPDLADTWTVDADGLVYSIKLKDNQFWSDGKKITADDLIYTSYKVADLVGVATDKVDDLTVRYTLPNKYSPFLSLLTIGVMHTDSEEKENPLKPNASGDWKVARTKRVGKSITQITLITRSDKYPIKKIIFKYYANEDELATAGKLGEIDGFLSTKKEEISGFEDFKFPTQGIYYALYFNLNNESLKDLAFRQKLEKVLDIKEMIFDKGVPVEGSVSRSIFTDRNLKFDKYDPTFREDLSGQTVKLTIPDIPGHIDLAEKIKAVWKDKLGLDVQVEKINPKDMVNNVVNPRNFEILFYGQEVGRDPDRYVNWHSTQKITPGLNLSSFEHVRGDRALEEGRKELDNDKRLIHYKEFQKSINENTPAIFLYHPFTHYYVSKYISGIGEKYTFTQADRFLDFENWKIIQTN